MYAIIFECFLSLWRFCFEDMTKEIIIWHLQGRSESSLKAESSENSKQNQPDKDPREIIYSSSTWVELFDYFFVLLLLLLVWLWVGRGGWGVVHIFFPEMCRIVQKKWIWILRSCLYSLWTLLCKDAFQEINIDLKGKKYAAPNSDTL